MGIPAVARRVHPLPVNPLAADKDRKRRKASKEKERYHHRRPQAPYRSGTNQPVEAQPVGGIAAGGEGTGGRGRNRR